MSLQGIADYIWTIHHDDENSQWGSAYEIGFWILVVLINFGLVIWSAWNLAVKHTEATGSSVLVEVKPDKVKADKVSSSASGDSNLLGGTTSRRKNKGGLSRFWQSSS